MLILYVNPYSHNKTHIYISMQNLRTNFTKKLAIILSIDFVHSFI